MISEDFEYTTQVYWTTIMALYQKLPSFIEPLDFQHSISNMLYLSYSADENWPLSRPPTSNKAVEICSKHSHKSKYVLHLVKNLICENGVNNLISIWHLIINAFFKLRSVLTPNHNLTSVTSADRIRALPDKSQLKQVFVHRRGFCLETVSRASASYRDIWFWQFAHFQPRQLLLPLNCLWCFYSPNKTSARHEVSV